MTEFEKPLSPINNQQVFYPLQVVNVVSETADACSIVLQIDAAFAEKFVYQSGQYLTFEIPWGSFSIQRSYSLCSAPESGELPTVTVKRVANGRASNWFNDHIKAGMGVMVASPAGRFVLGQDDDAALVFAAGGSGITPIISIIKTVLQATSRNVLLIYANRDQASVIFYNQLAALVKRYPDRFTCHHHLDSEGIYLDAEKIVDFIGGRWDADFYICGPQAYMDLVENTLYCQGVKRSKIFIERFASPIDPDQVNQKTDSSSRADMVVQGDVKLTITLNGVDVEVPYLSGTTLLDSVLADSSLKDVPHSCQQGHCGSCMSILKTGEVKMQSNRVLSKRDLAAGYVLPCQSVPMTNEVWIDFDV